jgi:hypothetical protein
MDLPKVGPVALRLVIGPYVSQREKCYLNSQRFLVLMRANSADCGDLNGQIARNHRP